MILTRSPQYYTANFPSPVGSVTRTDFELIIGTGSIASLTPVKTYTLTKSRPSADFTKAWVNMSNMIRENYLRAPLVTAGTASAEIRTSALQEVLIAKITPSFVNSAGRIDIGTASNYIAADGYGHYIDGPNYNPTKKILLSNNYYIADSRGFVVVPLAVASGDSNPTVNGVAVSLAFSETSIHYLKYLVIPVGNYTGSFDVVFEGETVTFEVISECKYSYKEFQFVNRFGAIETMHFFKTQKDTISFDKEEFQNNYYNGTTYNSSVHQIKQLNVRSNTRLKVETGFLPEGYNYTIKELLRSEQVWLNGYPINPKTNSLSIKTRINDKLISYSIDFEYAFNDINDI